MAIKIKTEADLTELGLTIDPSNPTQAVRIADHEQPDESWPVERLMAYGAASFSESSRLLDEAVVLARRSTVHIFRAGRALSIAQEKASATKSWGSELAAHNIPRTTAWEAIQLYERAKKEEAIASMTISEAKQAFGITKAKGALAPEDEEDDTSTCGAKPARTRKGSNLVGDSPEDRQDEENEEPTASEVRCQLNLASEYLDKADIGCLPLHDEAELGRIVLAAQDCETTAARVLAKAKELVALEPEIISIGID